MKNTLVRPSDVHGKGLFAARDFAPGEFVESIEGNIVLGESQSKYAIALKDRRSLILTNKVKYVNHAREANVTFDLKKGLVAIAPIKAGDELFSRYGSIFG